MPYDRPYVKANKIKAAHLARLFLAKKLVFEELDELYPKDTSNQTIDILYKLIKSQPKAFGIYGIGIIKFDAYNAGILKLIELLEGTGQVR
jgi:hypothetical protein